MSEQNNNQAVKLPIVSTIIGPLALVFSGGFNALFLCIAFAAIPTIVMGLTGNLTSCITESFRTNHYCTTSIWVFLLAQLLIFVTNIIFIRNWLNILAERPLDWRQVFVPCKRDFKVGGFLLILFATLGIALFSLYLLYVRQPNPNWRIEIVYFAVVSLGFFVPVLSIRFWGYIAATALGEKLMSPKIIWQKTSGNMFVLLGGAFVSFIIIMIMLVNLLQFIHNAAISNNLGQAWIVEFIYSFTKLIAIILFANFCYLLNKNLSERKENE